MRGALLSTPRYRATRMRPMFTRNDAPAYLAGAAAATSTISIAASQILLGAAILSLLLHPSKLRWPPVTLPLLLFMGWTLVSLAFSPDPRTGLPQVRKFYEYTMLFAVFSAIRTLREVRWLIYGVIGGATISALWALGQFVQIYRSTPDLFYYVYSNGSRVTGFMSHWMTFSGITMMALMLAAALLLFDRASTPLFGAIAAMGAGLLAGFQRTMWAGTTLGSMWLLWSRKKWLVALVPVTAAILLAASPLLRDRILSIFQPQLNIVNSTAHRAALRATGWEMIKAHPLVGVGPEMVSRRLVEYAPASVLRPWPTEWSKGHLHNVYYQYAAERGLPALAAMVWFLGRALYDFWRARRIVEGRWMLLGAIASILAVMVAGLAEHNLNDSEPLGVFLSIVACGYVVRDAQTS
jgi:putative inorganic carbon (hco3(-)) transporter